MNLCWRCWYWKLGLAISLAITPAIAYPGDCVRAQITPDGTLGAESSVVTPDNINNLPSDRIDGGAIRGANLFHSFREFDVGEGRGAYFTNPAAIQNVLSRVTGNDPSDILGKLGVLGNANLFLINPNGIIFGPNASLDINGSFVGTTANSVRLGDTGVFSASEPATSNLLTVNPSALFFNALAARREITNQSRVLGLNGETNVTGGPVGLQVPAGQTLALVGGNVLLDDGNLTAKGGRIEIGSVEGVGEVGLSQIENGLVLDYNSIDSFGEIILENTAVVDATAGGGGSIAVTAADIVLNNSSLRAGIGSNLGSVDAQAGDITLNATELVSLDNSFIQNNVFSDAVGNSGSVNITTGSLFVKNNAQIQAIIRGQGNAGNITIVARDTVSFDGRDRTDRFPSAAFTSVEPGAVGNGGNINITTGSLSITNRAQLLSNTEGTGNAGNIFVEARDQVSLSNSIMISEVSEEGGVGNGGDIKIKAGSLLLKDGSSLLADMENRGNAGNITIEARDAVILEGTGPGARTGSALDGFIVPSQITATVESQAVGNGGNINISAGSLSLTDEGFISASTFGQGDAGSIIITTGNLAATNDAQISARTSGPGKAGNLTIAAERLSVRDGARLTTSTSGTGNAGNLTVVDADLVELVGTNTEGTASGLFANASEGASGIGGNLTIETRQLYVSDGAEVAVSSEGTGAAGKLEVVADSIRLDNLASLRADTTAGQGNIFLRSRDLVLRRGSNITTNATGTAIGGNITIDTGIIFAFEDSDISANAQNARGGRVIIDAQGIFGTKFQENETPQSDITATSELGIEFSGIVEINRSDVDPSQGLVNLPTELVDASSLIASSCEASGENKFIVTGRGGLPPNPSDMLSSDTVWSDLRYRTQQAETQPSSTVATQPANSITGQLVEAQGWVINNKGEVVLTATAPTVTPHSPGLTTAECHTP